jgi:uncharacterized protein YyaL (SSP411 family)
LLLRHHRRTGDEKSLEMAVLTLEKMAAGGIHDQIGGGFHHYATDAAWRVPHFEKMLYDNALLVPAYIEGWQATGNARLLRVAVDTLAYVAREMTSPRGAFFSATDAESLTPAGRREEGYYFTWTPGELDDVLGSEDARVTPPFTVFGPRATSRGAASPPCRLTWMRLPGPWAWLPNNCPPPWSGSMRNSTPIAKSVRRPCATKRFWRPGTA